MSSLHAAKVVGNDLEENCRAELMIGEVETMRIATIVFSLSLISGMSIEAQAAEVSRSVTVNASPEQVWEVIGPFCAIADWYPGLDSCEEETTDGTTRRRLTTADGGQFLERLQDQNDGNMSYSYAIEEGPLPVADYSSTISVTESGGDTVITWESTFAPDGVSEDEAVEVVTGVYDGGLEALQQRFAK